MRLPSIIYYSVAIISLFLGIRKEIGMYGYYQRMKRLHGQKIEYLLVIMDCVYMEEYVVDSIEVQVFSCVLTNECGLNGKGARFLDIELGNRCTAAIDKLRNDKFNYLVMAASEFEPEPGITHVEEDVPEGLRRLVEPIRKAFKGLPRRVS